MTVHEIALTSSFEGKLLGINLNSKLKKHMTDICNKVSQKNALSKITGYITAQKIKFSLKISSLNATKSTVSYGFGHIY